MKMKRMLAILLAACLMLALAACGNKGDTTATTTAGDAETTTVVGDGEPVDGEETTEAGATETTVTDKDGNVVTTTTQKGATTRKTKNLIGITTQTVGGSTAAGGQISVGAPITIKEGTVPCEKGKSGNGQTFTYGYYGSSWSEKHKAWFDQIKHRYTFTPENTEDILKKEIGAVFERVLEDAGVYKRTAEGKSAFLKFINSVNN